MFNLANKTALVTGARLTAFPRFGGQAMGDYVAEISPAVVTQM